MRVFTSPTGTVDPRSWDRLAGRHLYASSSWLRFCHGEDPGRTGGLHCGPGSEPSAAVPVTAVRDPANPFYRWRDRLSERGLPSPPQAGLMAGQHRGYRTTLIHRNDLGLPEAAAALLPRLRQLAADPAVATLTGASGAVPCVAMYVDTPTVEAFTAAGARSPAVLLQLEAWIPVPCDGWDAYLASLGSSRAGIVRRDIRRFTDSGHTVEHLGLDRCYTEAGYLLACTERRHGNEANPESLAISLKYQAAVGPRAEVLLCRTANGNPAGFCLFYERGDTLYLRAAGFDYEMLNGSREYFNLVYYRPLREAIARGLKWVHAGIESIEAKALRGAQLHGLWLLDLSEQSVLYKAAEEVRATNIAYLRKAVDFSPAVTAAVADPCLKALLR
jgi:hypothetical protein